MTGEQAARRYPASTFPEIQGIRLAPIGVSATLVNLSASGVLVECAGRAVPGSMLTVQFKGTFSPATIEGRVVRCEVMGIAADGSLRFHLGLAFSSRITLAIEAGGEVEASMAVPVAPLVAAAAAAVSAEPVLRNRW
jgi:hypothetical protein